MNVTAHDNGNATAHVAAPGPGILLKDAREAAGLSRQEVAAKLHLDLKVVTALEADEFSALPAETFVRGYLRSYTQLLGVPTGPVIEALENAHLSPPTLIADISEAPQASSDDIPVRLVSYIVIAALTVMVVLWWHNQNFDYQELLQPGSETPAPESESSSQTPPEETAQNNQDQTGVSPPIVSEITVANSPQPPNPAESTESAPSDTGDEQTLADVETQNTDTTAMPGATSSEQVTNLQATDPARLTQQLQQAENTIEASRKIMDQSQSPVATPVEPQEPVATTATRSLAESAPAAAPATQKVPSSGTPVATREAAPGANSSTSGQDTLSLHFTRESWVSVYDHNDNRLFYGLTRPDQTVELQGPGPLRVLLGRPQGVTVLYDGKPLDLSPYISSSGIARFTGKP